MEDIESDRERWPRPTVVHQQRSEVRRDREQFRKDLGRLSGFEERFLRLGFYLPLDRRAKRSPEEFRP